MGSTELKNRHLDLQQMGDGANYAMKRDYSITREGPRAALPPRACSGRCEQSCHSGQKNNRSCGDCWVRTHPREHVSEEACSTQGVGSSAQNTKKNDDCWEQTGGSLDDRVVACRDRWASKLVCS